MVKSLPKLLFPSVRAGFTSLALVLLVCSCATSKNPTTDWIKDNQKIGTIETRPGMGGMDKYYKNLSGQVMRIEKVGYNGQISPGASVTIFSYADGTMSEEQHQDTSGRLTMTGEGFAVRRWHYVRDEQNSQLIVEESLYDASQKPVCGLAGYALVRRIEDVNGRMKNIKFLDVNGNAAATTWLGLPNVAEARYEYLQALTEVACVAFLDRDGKVFNRKQISGSDSFSSQTTTRDNYNYQPVYYYRPAYHYR